MIINLSDYGCIRVAGENAQLFLQGQLTCDMREISKEKASYAAYCNHKGRTLGILRVIQHEQDYLLFTTGKYVDPLFKNLKKYGQFSKVQITLESPTRFHYGICGENAASDLKKVTQLEIPTQTNQVIQNNHYLIFKNAGENNIELISWNSEIPNALIDDAAWQKSLIESLVPAITEITCEKFTPHMLGLKNLNALSFKKGCYVGQEIVARTEHLGKNKRKLESGICTDQTINEGSVLNDNTGNEIGTIINYCHLDDHSIQWLAVVSAH